MPKDEMTNACPPAGRIPPTGGWSPLDLEKFEKFHTLATHGLTPGERDAALASAMSMVEASGMTLEEAIGLLDAKPMLDLLAHLRPDPEPYNEKDDAAERDAEIARLIDLYGSEEAVFAETENELALDKALDHLSVRVKYVNQVTGEPASYVSQLAGCERLYNYADLSASVAQAARDAYPMPEDLQGVLEEVLAWDKLAEDRCNFGEYQHGPAVQAREALLRHELDTRRVQNWSDFAARAEWARSNFEDDHIAPRRWQEAIQDRMADDMAILKRASEAELAELDMEIEAYEMLRGMR
jgi:hypothetical protein